MQVGEKIEFGPGLIGVVVWPGDALMPHVFVLEYDGQYAACEGDAEEFSMLFEDAWRDSFVDAMCDVDLANEACD